MSDVLKALFVLGSWAMFFTGILFAFLSVYVIFHLR